MPLAVPAFLVRLATVSILETILEKAMGYSVSYTITDARIPSENWKQALDAINALFASNTRYRWLGAGTRNHSDLREAIEEWGFEVEADCDDFIQITCFQWEKSGEEEVMLSAIAPFIDPGATFECRGEDGENWRYVFRDGVMVRQEGRVIYK